MLPFDSNEIRRYPGVARAQLALLRWAQERSLRRANGVIFLSQWVKTHVLSRIGPLSGSAVVIPHGISARFQQAPREPRSLSVCSMHQPLRLLYVSKLSPYKNHDRVVKAAVELRNRGVPIRLELVGDGPLRERTRLQTLLMRVDPAKEVVAYHGPVKHESLPQVYGQADVFVFASTCENLPNILLEAMSSGLPIVCADRGPMREVLADAGIYFAPHRERSLAYCVERLIRDTDLRSKLARKAYDRSMQYSWRKAGSQTMQFLASVANASPLARCIV